MGTEQDCQVEYVIFPGTFEKSLFQRVIKNAVSDTMLYP